MNEQVTPAAWFVKTCEGERLPQRERKGRSAGKTDKSEDYEPGTGYSLSPAAACLSAILQSAALGSIKEVQEYGTST